MMISAHSLIMAIKATCAKMKGLADQIKGAKDPELSYLEEELHSYGKAQMELKDLYIERQRQAQNLPPYDDLIE